MSYPFIIKVFDQFYVMDTGTQYIETYSLRNATEFPSKEAATKWMNDYTDFEDYAEVIQKTPEVVAAYDEWAKTMTRRVFDKLDKSGKDDYDPEKHTKLDVLNFHLYDKWNRTICRDSARTWPDLYRCGFVSLFSVSNGKDRDRLSVEISVKPDTDAAPVIDELTFFMDHVGVTEQTFGVFDYFLCEHGDSVKLTLSPDDSAEISGTVSLEGSWQECIEYLIKHRYYPAKNDD